MTIGGALFHVHEERVDVGQVSPKRLAPPLHRLAYSPTTRTRCSKPRSPLAAQLSPMQDYDYGYRQGTVTDPFGHQWLLEKKIETA